jgi:hypothetical protein
MLNYIRATGFAGYVLNDCFGYFSGDIIERSLKALQVFMLLEAILHRFAQDDKCCNAIFWLRKNFWALFVQKWAYFYCFAMCAKWIIWLGGWLRLILVDQTWRPDTRQFPYNHHTACFTSRA